MDPAERALIDRYVRPFYLHMMSSNAVNNIDTHFDDLTRLGAEIATADVAALLGGHWRPRVMGAWFALFRPSEQVRAELLSSMATSLGGLTAPPLAAVAVHLLGADATPALRDFAKTEQGRVDQSAPFVSAALEHLGFQPTHPVNDTDRAALEAMLAVARRLHESF